VQAPLKLIVMLSVKTDLAKNTAHNVRDFAVGHELVMELNHRQIAQVQETVHVQNIAETALFLNLLARQKQ